MEQREEIDRLKARLHWESGGPLAHSPTGGRYVHIDSGELWRTEFGTMLRSGRSPACSLRSSWASPLADGGRAVRSISLLKLALEAELLRLRAMAARQGRRAVFAVVALIFAMVVLALAEVAGWLALRHRFPSIPATLILLGINLVIVAGFGVLAARSSPGHTEQEALRVRLQALEGARGSLALTAAVPTIAHVFRRRRRPTGRSWVPFMR